MISRVVFLLGVVSVSVGERRPVYSYTAPQGSDEYSDESREARYNFNYAVKHEDSGNDFGHQETRDGDDTKGSYYVQLPDGRLQTVTYSVDGDSGYVAEVSYQGEARYPDSDEIRSYAQRRPSHTPSRPSYTRIGPSNIAPRAFFASPRPSYSNPEAEESREVIVYASSEGSLETGSYSPPRYFAGPSEESSEEFEDSPFTHYTHPDSLNNYKPPVYIPNTRNYGF
ncbi:uncharacterized protein [Procambarus clarkii]|uniref:uncharacterized protein n=1 Tax=Procambarus clarkii TaxID=6728 RepID=UPI0037444EAD